MEKWYGQIYTYKRRPSGGRKIIPDRNLDLHRRMKSTGNGHYVASYKIHYFLYI